MSYIWIWNICHEYCFQLSITDWAGNYVTSIKLTIITMSVIIILLNILIDNNNNNNNNDNNNNDNNLCIYYQFKIYYGIIIFINLASYFVKWNLIISITTLYTVAYSFITSFIMYVYHNVNVYHCPVIFHVYICIVLLCNQWKPNFLKRAIHYYTYTYTYTFHVTANIRSSKSHTRTVIRINKF